MENTNKLFDLLKNHKYEEFKQYITDNPYTSDLNMRDDQGNFLLTYCVRLNRIGLVKFLFENNARYDIVNRHNQSIIYECLDNSYMDIFEEILAHSKHAIGIMITDIRDSDGSIPLHYAIRIKNERAIKLLLEYNSNPHIGDNNGLNALHHAVKTQSIDIVQLVVPHMNNLNGINNTGETALHISINYRYNIISTYLIDSCANLNIMDMDNEFTPLHYAVGWNNAEIVSHLLQNKADPNVQDIYGNTPIVYCIKEDHEQSFNEFFKYNTKLYQLDINLWNIDGRTAIHEFFNHYNDQKINYIDQMIGYTNVSAQDGEGHTALHYLAQYNLWKKYKDIMVLKKINMFAKNSYGNFVFDMIESSDMDEFIDMVVDSYILLLRRSSDWDNEIDSICSRDFESLNADDRNKLNGDIKNCHALIKNKLIDTMDLARKGKIHPCQRSYPYNQKECIELDTNNQIIVDICTFTGSLLDCLVGLMFLARKHTNNLCTILDKSKTSNKKICEFYKKRGLIMNNRCEFLNFELVWLESKLYSIDNFYDMMNRCRKTDKRFVIIPLGIELNSGSHSNYILYDKQSNEIERFEPHGGTHPIGFNYNQDMLDKILEEYFKGIADNIQYIRPSQYIPKIGFQLMESQEYKKKRIGDPGGFCALWSIWYCDQRLTYPHIKREKIILQILEQIRASNLSIRNLIRNYSRQIIQERDILLKNAQMDINDWLNDNYTTDQLNQLMNQLVKKIDICCSHQIS